jgi:hypothetical protein
MRYLTPALIVVLMISLIANTVMVLKWRSGRPILSVNGVNMSKNDLDMYLESVYGTDFKASFVRRVLIRQAAEKIHQAMTPDEVTEKFQEAKQLQWTYAKTVNSSPWLAEEARRTIQEQVELARVQAHDIPVTPDDIRDEYNLNPAKYDTPSKALTEVAIIRKDSIHKSDILHLIGIGEGSDKNTGVKPSAVMAAYQGEVAYIGDNNVFTFFQRFGVPEQSLVFNMKEGDVLMVPPKQVPAEFVQAGYPTMVVHLIKIIRGHKADLEDPSKNPNIDKAELPERIKDYKKTMETLRLTVALKHANPAQEVLRNLYQNAKIEVEEPTDKEYIKRKLFPPDDTSATVATK